MKNLIFLVFLSISLNLHGQMLKPEIGGWVDSTGRIFSLRGVSLNGWLCWDGPSWGAPEISESKMYANIAAATSIKFAADFKEEIYQNYILKTDIQAIANMEFNCVNIPIHHSFFGRKTRDHVITNEDFLILDKTIEWCKEFGLYVILEMRSAPGGQNKSPTSDFEKNSLWKSLKHQNRLVEIWYTVANRYKNNSTVAAYNLLNSPYYTDLNVINSLFTRICDTISAVDNKHYVLVEGADFDFYKNGKYNLIYGFRIPQGGSRGLTPDELIEEANFLVIKNKIPGFCTEIGMFPFNTLTSVRKMLDAGDIGFCGDIYHSWKMVIADDNRALVEIQVTEPWVQIISGKKNKSGRSAEGIAREFIESIEYRLVMENREMEKAVIGN